MDAAGAAGGEAFVYYAAEILEYLNSLGLEGPSAKVRIGIIVPDLISLLPRPFIPATDDDGSSDSDDDHFSLTSSESRLSIKIVHAPRLFDSIGARRPIKIVHAPRLEVLGFLDLQLHTLEIGGIAIKAGMNVRACAMLPSVKILAVKVRFWDDMEAKMLTTLLRCFPQLETLHIMCIRSRSPDSTVDDTDFWNSLASCDCLDSHLKTFVVHGVQGRQNEAWFTRHIFKNAKVLKSYGMIYSDIGDVAVEGSDGSSSSDDVAVEEGAMSGSDGEGDASSGGSSGSDDAEVERPPMSGTVGEGNAPSGGSSGKYVFAHPAFPCWSFQNAIDLSVEDPFYVLGPVVARINLVGGETTR